VTTAQERRRARRVARSAAQGLASSTADAGAVAETATATRVSERPPAARTAARPAQLPPEPPPVATNGRDVWIAVKPARPSSSGAAPAPRENHGPKRWVAVKSRRAPAEVVEVETPTTEPPASETLEPLPGDPRDEANDADGGMSTLARALHPRSRAIRITRVKADGKRRWSVDFLVRGPDANQPRS
jgi:hypothetical protein